MNGNDFPYENHDSRVSENSVVATYFTQMDHGPIQVMVKWNHHGQSGAVRQRKRIVDIC